MTSTDTIKVEILAVTDKAVAALNTYADRVATAITQHSVLGKSILGAKAAFDTISSAMAPFVSIARTITRVADEMLTEFAESEKATVGLTNAFKQQGDYLPTTINNLTDLANKLQLTTSYADEVTVSAMAMLKQLTTLDSDAIAKLIPHVQDFAAGMNMDLVNAATLVAKTIGSSTNALTRYGIEVDASKSESEKLTAIIAELDAKFGGLAASVGESTSGKMAIFKNQISELKESLGGLIANTGLLQDFIDILYDLQHLSEFKWSWNFETFGLVTPSSIIKEKTAAINEQNKALREQAEIMKAFDARAELQRGLSGGSGGSPLSAGSGTSIHPGIAPPSMSAMMPMDDAFFAAVQGLEAYSAALDLAMAAEGRMAQKTTYLDTALANLGEQMASAALREGISALNKLGEAFGAGTLGESVSAADIIWDMVEALLNNMATLALGAAIKAAVDGQWVAFWILLGIAGVSAIAAGVMTGTQAAANAGTEGGVTPVAPSGHFGEGGRRESVVIHVHGSVWNGDDLAVAYGKALMRA